MRCYRSNNPLPARIWEYADILRCGSIRKPKCGMNKLFRQWIQNTLRKASCVLLTIRQWSSSRNDFEYFGILKNTTHRLSREVQFNCSMVWLPFHAQQQTCSIDLPNYRNKLEVLDRCKWHLQREICFKLQVLSIIKIKLGHRDKCKYTIANASAWCYSTHGFSGTARACVWYKCSPHTQLIKHAQNEEPFAPVVIPIEWTDL